uniref:Uncharacterized protein n=1 Tax=Strongyloides papillosus TaxID=174720 RepID=A0A0N5CHH4_STREA
MKLNNNILVGKKSQIRLKDLVLQICLMFLVIAGNIVVFLYQKGICRPGVQFLFRIFYKLDSLLRKEASEMDCQHSGVVFFSTPINPASKTLRRNFIGNGISPIVDKRDNSWTHSNVTGISL